jgi:hypothetical protein
MPYKDVPAPKGYKSTSKKAGKPGRSPWLDIQPANPVMDIWNPNKGGSKNAQAPDATKARGAPYSVKSTKAPKKGKKS